MTASTASTTLAREGNDPMTVRVLLFGHYRDAAPAEALRDGALTVLLPGDATVADLASALSELDPRFADLGTRTRAAVCTEFASADTVLHHGDEVAFLPPMSGG
jgi:molybdopterin synthase catalytic subunit